MVFSLRQLTLAVALCGVAVTSSFASEKVRLLASLPVTYGLGEALLKGTEVSLERAAPDVMVLTQAELNAHERRYWEQGTPIGFIFALWP